jgi:hypothetical protein
MRQSCLISIVIVAISATVTMAQTKKPADQNDAISPKADSEKGLDFWTPERLRDAQPTPLPKLTREEMERLKSKK